MSCRKAFGKLSASLPNDIDFFVPDTGPLNAEAWKARLVTSNSTQQVKLPYSGVIVRYAYVSQRGCVIVANPPLPSSTLVHVRHATFLAGGRWLANPEAHRRTAAHAISLPFAISAHVASRDESSSDSCTLHCSCSHRPGCRAGHAAHACRPLPCCTASGSSHVYFTDLLECANERFRCCGICKHDTSPAIHMLDHETETTSSSAFGDVGTIRTR